MRIGIKAGLLAAALALAAPLSLSAAWAERAPSVPTASAPELAPLGAYAVGTQETVWTNPGQPDVAAQVAGRAGALTDRALRIRLWHPAITSADAAPVAYPGAFPAVPGAPEGLVFTTPGVAIADAPLAEGRFPLIVLSHGFGGRPEYTSWLGENLASKGYIVVAPDHADRPFGLPGAFEEALVYRALDQAFVAQAALADPSLAVHIDPARIGLIGYSMGGYGALRTAGAPFNPQIAAAVQSGALAPLLAGGALDRGALIPNLRGVVALAPWGGQARFGAFRAEGLAQVRVPALVVAGTRDDISGYEDGVLRLYEGLTGTERRLLVFENAGHTLPSLPRPESAAGVFAYEGFTEDPVWRKDRAQAILQHFITAFLDLTVKGDASRAAYLPDSGPEAAADGLWPQGVEAPAEAFAAGQPSVTLWRGFPRRTAEGLRFRYAPVAP
jgi:dienelactone hydrolase